MYRVGIDLGGTNIAVGIVDDNNNIIARATEKTNAPRPCEEICESISIAVNNALKNANLTLDDVSSIGAGIPGTVNPETGVIGFSNNLGFSDVPLTEILEKKVGKKIFIDNDANAAALGEMIAGAGKDAKSFVAVTLGTGVGGGTIIDGKMLLGSNFAGGELGHTVIEVAGAECTCGRRGCFEAYSSATGLIRITKEVMMKNNDSKMWELVGDDITCVSGKTAFDAMRLGDKAGNEVVDIYCKYLACGITNIVNVFQPDVLCIGGGVSREGNNILSRIVPVVERERFSKNIEKQTVIKTAELGNDAGIIGAASLSNLY